MNFEPDANRAPGAQPVPGRAAMVGEIILATRRIETLLRKGNVGNATGIHALTEILADELPNDVRRKLHYLASVRNQAAHEKDYTPTAEDFAAFERCAAEVEAELLRRCEPESGGTVPTQGAAAAPEGLSRDELEVERALLSRWAHIIHYLGFVPAIGVLNQLRLLLLALFAQFGTGLLIVFYICAIPMLIEGVRNVDTTGRGLLQIGIATFIAVYAATVFLALRHPVAGLSKWFYYVPGLHIVYLAVRWVRNLQWGKFLLSLAGPGALCAGVMLARQDHWDYAGWALLTQWLSAVAAGLLWPPKN